MKYQLTNASSGAAGSSAKTGGSKQEAAWLESILDKSQLRIEKQR